MHTQTQKNIHVHTQAAPLVCPFPTTTWISCHVSCAVLSWLWAMRATAMAPCTLAVAVRQETAVLATGFVQASRYELSSIRTRKQC